MLVTNDEATIDDSTEIQDGPASQPLLIGTVYSSYCSSLCGYNNIVIILIILVSVIICKKRSKSFNVTQQSSLQLGVTEDDSGNGRETASGDQSLAGIIAGVVLVILTVTVIVSTVLLSIIVTLVRQRAHQGTNKIPITPPIGT